LRFNMRRIRVIHFLAIVAFLPATSRAQTIPDQIDAILARTAVAGNTWTVLVENTDGSVIYFQRNPTTGQAPVRA
jgi:D-alanyl-D-alanine carboxypeptidase